MSKAASSAASAVLSPISAVTGGMMPSTPKPPKVEPLAPPPTLDAQGQRAAIEEQRRLRAAMGIGSTILTTGLGVAGGNEQRKTLLGG
jgi:hypothetical protein